MGNSILDGIDSSAKNTASSLDSVTSAIRSLSTAGFKDSKILDSMAASIESTSRATNSFLAAIKSLDGVGDVFGPGIEAMQSINGLMSSAAKIAIEVTQGYDAIDSGLRDFTANQYKLGAGIGATFEESEKFVGSYRNIIKANSDMSNAGLYIGSQDVKDAIDTMQKAGVTIDVLAEKTHLFGTELTYAQGMAVQAKAMGMNIADYSTKIAAMVRTNGLSMEESMKLMGESQQIARETGLRVDEVAGSLDRASAGFVKMGMTMDFGRPILRGFAESVKDVGLGISQASGLAETFSSSLGAIINNPALAYITTAGGAGGAGMGGGILNPSIQMQASMLDQSPDNQAKMAKELSEGMRDTLKQFTGGDIITVKQAAESPELQTKFYAQQQMLGSTYGISGTDNQNRVLEYLTKLEDATYSGDEESAKLLQQQFNEVMKGNDATVGIQEKISANIEKSVMILQETAQIEKLKLAADLKSRGLGDDWNGIVKKMNSIAMEYVKDPKSDKYASESASLEKDLNDLSKLMAKAQAAADQKAAQPPDDGGKLGTDDRTSRQNETMPGHNKTTTESNIKITLDKQLKGTLIPSGNTAAGIPTFTFQYE